MKRSVGMWQLMGFAITSFGGTILHFLYEWLGNARWIAPFSGVNESTWEHMKLLFWPLLLFALIQRIFFQEQENYWCVKLCSIMVGLILIPILFYTLNGMFGTTPDWVNIVIFYVSAASAFFLEWWLFKEGHLPCKHPWVAFFGILLIGVLFVVFTFIPPQIPLFQDPLAEKHDFCTTFLFYPE